MRVHKFQWTALFLTVLLAQTPAPTLAQTPADEDSLEDALDEDDGSPAGFEPEEFRSSDEIQESDDIIGESADPTPTSPTAETQPSTPAEPDSQKIFDWSRARGEREVKHPFAEKGLIRIDKDRAYFYRVKPSDQNRAVSVHVGLYDPLNLSNPDNADSPNASFESNYDQSANPAVIFQYEWQLWRSPIGKLGLRLGSGLFVAQGHGHFVNEVNQDLEPRENFTFLMFPNSLGAVYRMHIWDKQLIVPYAEGGGTAFAFSEIRDDDTAPKFGGAFGAYVALGGALNMTYFDYMSRIQLDREYGINACYLALEYRRFQAITTRYDFTSDYINAGILVEY